MMWFHSTCCDRFCIHNETNNQKCRNQECHFHFGVASVAMGTLFLDPSVCFSVLCTSPPNIAVPNRRSAIPVQIVFRSFSASSTLCTIVRLRKIIIRDGLMELSGVIMSVCCLRGGSPYPPCRHHGGPSPPTQPQNCPTRPWTPPHLDGYHVVT